MRIIFIRRTVYGAYDISSNFSMKTMMYMGYPKREAIRKYRELTGTKGKHIEIWEW